MLTTTAMAEEKEWSQLVPEKAGGNIIDSLAEGSSWDAELGIQFRENVTDEIEGEGEDVEAGWGYLEFGWESGSVHGLQLGVGGLAITELWYGEVSEGLFDNGGDFGRHERWTEAYIKYSLPNTKTHFILGRADDGKFGEPVAGDGDYYQGIGVTIKDIPRITIKAHAVNAWLNDASASWDMDGIQSDWQDMDDVVRDEGGIESDAGDFAYTLMTEINAVDNFLTVTPYVQYHKDVATSLGTSFNAESVLRESLTVGLDGAYVKHFEDTPDAASATDEDVSQRALYAYGKFKNLKLGIGYYGISDDIPIFNTKSEGGDDFEDVFIMDEFDPMEQDLAKYGETQGNDTFYIDAGYSYGPFDLEVAYGWCKNAVVQDAWNRDGEATELNVILGLNITENLKGELAYVSLSDDYTGDKDRSMDYVAGSLAYKF